MTSPHVHENTSLNSSEGIGMSNSTEMVRRVAKAMQESKAWPVVFDAGSADELARVAIAAMRSPTQQMRMAVWKLMENNPALDRKQVMGSAWPDAICGTLVKAALSPEDEGSQRK